MKKILFLAISLLALVGCSDNVVDISGVHTFCTTKQITLNDVILGGDYAERKDEYFDHFGCREDYSKCGVYTFEECVEGYFKD